MNLDFDYDVGLYYIRDLEEIRDELNLPNTFELSISVCSKIKSNKPELEFLMKIDGRWDMMINRLKSKELEWKDRSNKILTLPGYWIIK